MQQELLGSMHGPMKVSAQAPGAVAAVWTCYSVGHMLPTCKTRSRCITCVAGSCSQQAGMVRMHSIQTPMKSRHHAQLSSLCHLMPHQTLAYEHPPTS